MLEWVFFDLYGTLIDIRTEEGSVATTRQFERWVAAVHGPAAAAREVHHPLFGDVRRARAPGPFGEPDLGPVIAAHLAEVLGRTASAADVAAAAIAFRAASRTRFAPVAGAAEALRLLAGRFRLALVSNAQSLFTRPELDELRIAEFFDPVVLSSEVGVRKPGPEIFARALAGAEVRPAAVLHVGDDPDADVGGATAVGLRTCLVGPAAHRADLPVVPDLRAGSVAELPALLLG